MKPAIRGACTSLLAAARDLDQRQLALEAPGEACVGPRSWDAVL